MRALARRQHRITAHKRGKINFDDLQRSTGSYSPMGAYQQSKLANESCSLLSLTGGSAPRKFRSCRSRRTPESPKPTSLRRRPPILLRRPYASLWVTLSASLCTDERSPAHSLCRHRGRCARRWLLRPGRLSGDARRQRHRGSDCSTGTEYETAERLLWRTCEDLTAASDSCSHSGA